MPRYYEDCTSVRHRYQSYATLPSHDVIQQVASSRRKHPSSTLKYKYPPKIHNHTHFEEHDKLRQTDKSIIEQQKSLALSTTEAIEILANAVKKLKSDLSEMQNESSDILKEHSKAIENLVKLQEQGACTYAEAIEKIVDLGRQSSLQATESLQLIYTLTGRDDFMIDPPELQKKETCIEIPFAKLKNIAELHKARENEIRAALQELSL